VDKLLQDAPPSALLDTHPQVIRASGFHPVLPASLKA
jgi:hypothetical protein